LIAIEEIEHLPNGSVVDPKIFLLDPDPRILPDTEGQLITALVKSGTGSHLDILWPLEKKGSQIGSRFINMKYIKLFPKNFLEFFINSKNPEPDP
jgi:hypothetical protein